MAAFCYLLPRYGLTIVRQAVDSVSPPDDLDPLIGESEENDDGGKGDASVETRTQNICADLRRETGGIGAIHTVVTLPPVESALSDVIIEREANYEPQRVLRRVGRSFPRQMSACGQEQKGKRTDISCRVEARRGKSLR